jgi:hypothetical protein
MDTGRWQQIDRLLDEALGRAPEERADFLAEACGADAELRRAAVRTAEGERVVALGAVTLGAAFHAYCGIPTLRMRSAKRGSGRSGPWRGSTLSRMRNASRFSYALSSSANALSFSPSVAW